MSFTGFKPDALQFFTHLSENNSKDWFTAHKGKYEETVKGPMVQLLAQLVGDFHAAGVPLSAEPNKSIMRPNRDIRFSKDKSPYKTNIAATLTRSGERHHQGVVYIHLEPGDCFVGTGFYALEPAELAAMRGLIVSSPDDWRETEAALAKAGLVLSREDSLSRPPKGFDADLPEDLAAAVRLKSFVTRLVLSPDELQSPELAKRITNFAAANMPLLNFGWRALGLGEP